MLSASLLINVATNGPRFPSSRGEGDRKSQYIPALSTMLRSGSPAANRRAFSSSTW